MLRQTLVRYLARQSALSATSSLVAPAALMASVTAFRATAASSQTAIRRPSPAAAVGSLRLYSIDVTRRTDFADKGPISYDEVKELTQTPGVRLSSPFILVLLAGRAVGRLSAG